MVRAGPGRSENCEETDRAEYVENVMGRAEPGLHPRILMACIQEF